MARNITMKEYGALLREVCPTFGNDQGADISEYREPRWTSMGGNLSVSISFGTLLARESMRPVVKLGGSACLPTDAVRALAILEDNRDTLVRAMKAWTMLGDVVVWFRDCPCGVCGGRGVSRGDTCTHCNGAGVRNDPEEGE